MHCHFTLILFLNNFFIPGILLYSKTQKAAFEINKYQQKSKGTGAISPQVKSYPLRTELPPNLVNSNSSDGSLT